MFHHRREPEYAVDPDYPLQGRPIGYRRDDLVTDDYGIPVPVTFSDPDQGLYADNELPYRRPEVIYGGEGYGREGYGREGYGHGREGYGHGREGYGREGYGREGYGREGYGREGYREGYGREELGREEFREGFGREGYGPRVVYERPVVVPPVIVSEEESSDLGRGVRDSDIVRSSDYRAGYGRSEAAVPYGAGYSGGESEEVRRLERELEHERKHKHEAEAAAAAALGFGLYERHGKHNAEDEEDGERHGRKHHHHHFFGID